MAEDEDTEFYGVEPQTPFEREIAMIMCRLNCWHTPLTDLPVGILYKFKSDPNNYFIRVWIVLNNTVNDDHWKWMWNHGEHLWKVPAAPTSTSESSRTYPHIERWIDSAYDVHVHRDIGSAVVKATIVSSATPTVYQAEGRSAQESLDRLEVMLREADVARSSQ